jgi:hypothetical protein
MIRQCVSVAAGVVGLVGCLSLDKPKLEADPVPEAISRKVALMGQQIQQKNPDLPLKVTCSTVGSPEPEIFSRVAGDCCAVYVTVGVINKCKTDGQLAAVICQEVGKAVAQHISQANLKLQQQLEQSNTPASVPIGNDLGGRFGPTGGIMPTELARQDMLRKRAQQPAPPPPADSLARIYLAKAGFNARELADVQSLLREAQRNNTFEKQWEGPTGTLKAP